MWVGVWLVVGVEFGVIVLRWWCCLLVKEKCELAEGCGMGFDNEARELRS